MTMMKREVAWRIFAEEFNNSNLESGGDSERSPSYVVTPLGAMVNRIYVVGVLTEVENRGTPEEPMWLARVSDPTGTFFISAGQFQPEVATALSNLEPPKFVAVVGKTNVYRPDEETVLTSIRGEMIKEVDEDQRNYWILEAAKNMKLRLEATAEASKMEEVSVEELIALGYERKIAEGVQKALEHYGRINFERYYSMLNDSLRYVLPEYEKPSQGSSSAPKKTLDDSLLDNILEKMYDMESGSGGEDGVEYDDIRDVIMDSENISMAEFEEAVSELMRRGELREPALGYLKLTE